MNRALPLGLLALTLDASLSACGDEDDDQVLDEIRYRAVLAPLNDSGVVGTADFVEDRDDDRFTASVLAEGVDASTLHPQHVHAGAACPTEAADGNDDGVVDVVEGVPAYGAILIPLDGDLEDQAAGMPDGYPTAPVGTIVYEETATLSAMIANLQAAEPESPLTGLEGPLNLSERTVVLHGVAETSSTTLPDSVQTFEGTPAYVSVPIACGTIEIIAIED